MTNLILEGIKSGAVIPTDLTRKLTIDGITKVYQVYKIRLDLLYYNEKNDRIATWISKYKAENGDDKFADIEKDEFNDIIQKFIYESNPKAIEKTKANISLVDQREPGVVLQDGRIIDGNRRFTCLRLLASQNDRFKYFEAVILNKGIEENEKAIKMLELAIQHGEEGKIDYNPVDRLVGIYNDIIDKKLFSVNEYARSTNESEAEIKKKMEQAVLMVEFLEFINAPKHFYIARDLELDGPIIELAGILRKCKDEETKENIKNSIFTNLLMKPNGDMTRFVRQVKTIVDSEYLDEFLGEQLSIAEEVIDNLPTEHAINAKYINDNIRTNNEIIERLENSMEKSVTKVKKTETKNKPLQLIEKSIISLESIDVNILQKLNEKELRRIKNGIKNLQEAIDTINEKCEELL